MELCLFDEAKESRIEMRRGDDDVWSVGVPGVGAGQRYGFRADGPFDPSRGLRFNPQKLLVDPYARFIDGHLDWNGPLFDGPERRNEADSASAVPKSVVIDAAFDWEGDERPRTPWRSTIIYETHVKGFSISNPAVGLVQRGTFSGLASKPSIDHLAGLGVTAVELLPVHHHIDDHRLVRAGLSNYWGFQTLGFFAPHAGYASSSDPSGAVREFKQMVKALHASGIEVILDVAYNHSGEGGDGGPTLCMRGLDNPTYYRLDPADLSRYIDVTGVENTLDLTHPAVIQMVMDSLRYWVEDMHVDGFRFDLAVTLGRNPDLFDTNAPLFSRIANDPVLADVKLIAEPWDLGSEGYQLGRFPDDWAEWNDRFRDDVRDLWRGEQEAAGRMGPRMFGSADVFGDRAPWSSLNLITAHDGFTLRDLVSYNQKHNLTNGEDNRDGLDWNRSWNCGVEGDTDDRSILDLRARQMRNLMATLMLSRGVPMILGGDEMNRTQGGNNNAYCHDGPVSWFDWDLGPEALEMLGFTRRLVRLRQRLGGDPAWSHAESSPSGCVTLRTDRMIMLINPRDTVVRFPVDPRGQCYTVIDSSDPSMDEQQASIGDAVDVAPRSLVVLRYGS